MSGWSGDFDVLPDTTSDERHEGRDGEDESNDGRLLAERPPHWA